MVVKLSRALTIFVAAISLAGAPVFAGTSNGPVKTTVLSPITLVNSQGIDFGQVIPTTVIGLVAIDAQTGARTTDGGATLVGSGGNPALFSGTGAAGQVIDLDTDASPVIVTNATGATMRVNRHRISFNGEPSNAIPRNQTIPASGVFTIGFGATLRVTPGQQSGVYQGNFDLIVNYQ
jgi:hypothetical protein